jgi:hypothetical protein
MDFADLTKCGERYKDFLNACSTSTNETASLLQAFDCRAMNL